MGTGLLFGTPGGPVFGHALEGMLHGVAPAHLSTFAPAALVVLAVGAVTAVQPGLSAVRTDPRHTLRSG